MKASMDWLALKGAEFSAGNRILGRAHLQNYTVDYQMLGEGHPIVLVPGLAGGMELLGPLARQLAVNYRVITYQLRGEDDAFALRRRFGLADLVADLAEFLEWHCLETPTIMGVSFGGAVALEFAASYPRRLNRLILQGAGAKFERGLLQRLAGAVLSGFPLPANNPFVNQFFNLLFGRRQTPGPLFDFVTRQCWQTDQSVMAHRFHLVEQFDVTSRLGQIVVPTLILAGDRDMLVSTASLKALRCGLLDHRFIDLPSCGHLAFITNPKMVTDAVRDFVK